MKITIKAKVTDDSRNKLGLIQSEYQNYQTYLQSRCKAEVNLYSATKQQAERQLREIQSDGELDVKKQYPVILRNDLVNIQKDSKFEGVYWIKIPVYPKSINVRIHTAYRYDLSEYDIRECKLIRLDDEWYIFITIEKQDELLPTTDNVLSIDLGCKNMAVTVNTANMKPNFYGSELRRIRGFYFHLRRQLGKKKAFYKIKTLKNREFLRVNHELHKISKAIVDEAKRTNAVIVLGKLKGIRKNIKGSRRVRRVVNNFPYYRLVEYIRYKAEWRGILVFEVGEANTSNTCSICHKRDKEARITQGLFRCRKKDCHREMNADYNAAVNILQRGRGLLSRLGGFLTYPNFIFEKQPSMIVNRNKMIMMEHVPSAMLEPHSL